MAYRLAWWEDPQDVPGLLERHDPIERWIIFPGPDELVSHVRDRGWSDARPVEVEQVADLSPVASVLTRVEDVLRWNHREAALPRAAPGVSRPVYPSIVRARFLGDLRRLVEEAVTSSVLSRDRALGLLKLAEDNTLMEMDTFNPRLSNPSRRP